MAATMCSSWQLLLYPVRCQCLRSLMSIYIYKRAPSDRGDFMLWTQALNIWHTACFYVGSHSRCMAGPGKSAANDYKAALLMQQLDHTLLWLLYALLRTQTRSEAVRGTVKSWDAESYTRNNITHPVSHAPTIRIGLNFVTRGCILAVSLKPT